MSDEPSVAIFQLFGFLLGILMLIGFFNSWWLLNRIWKNSIIISRQLDQLLKVSGVVDPVKDRQEAEKRSGW